MPSGKDLSGQEHPLRIRHRERSEGAQFSCPPQRRGSRWAGRRLCQQCPKGSRQQRGRVAEEVEGAARSGRAASRAARFKHSLAHGSCRATLERSQARLRLEGTEQMRDSGTGKTTFGKKPGSAKGASITARDEGTLHHDRAPGRTLHLSRRGNPRQREFPRVCDSERVSISTFQQPLPSQHAVRAPAAFPPFLRGPRSL